MTGVETPILASSAVYAFARYDWDSACLDAVALLRTHGIALSPGSEFGAAGEPHLRNGITALEHARLETPE